MHMIDRYKDKYEKYIYRHMYMYMLWKQQQNGVLNHETSNYIITSLLLLSCWVHFGKKQMWFGIRNWKCKVPVETTWNNPKQPTSALFWKRKRLSKFEKGKIGFPQIREKFSFKCSSVFFLGGEKVHLCSFHQPGNVTGSTEGTKKTFHPPTRP